MVYRLDAFNLDVSGHVKAISSCFCQVFHILRVYVSFVQVHPYVALTDLRDDDADMGHAFYMNWVKTVTMLET